MILLFLAYFHAEKRKRARYEVRVTENGGSSIEFSWEVEVSLRLHALSFPLFPQLSTLNVFSSHLLLGCSFSLPVSLPLIYEFLLYLFKTSDLWDCFGASYTLKELYFKHTFLALFLWFYVCIIMYHCIIVNIFPWHFHPVLSLVFVNVGLAGNIENCFSAGTTSYFLWLWLLFMCFWIYSLLFLWISMIPGPVFPECSLPTLRIMLR